MTRKGIFTNTEAIVKNLNLTPRPSSGMMEGTEALLLDNSGSAHPSGTLHKITDIFYLQISARPWLESEAIKMNRGKDFIIIKALSPFKF
jgi:hypothetical protein